MLKGAPGIEIYMWKSEPGSETDTALVSNEDSLSAYYHGNCCSQNTSNEINRFNNTNRNELKHKYSIVYDTYVEQNPSNVT